jgi:peptidoglycan L-alanyl-D-glutamate endopeptidase CwlK
MGSRLLLQIATIVGSRMCARLLPKTRGNLEGSLDGTLHSFAWLGVGEPAVIRVDAFIHGTAWPLRDVGSVMSRMSLSDPRVFVAALSPPESGFMTVVVVAITAYFLVIVAAALRWLAPTGGRTWGARPSSDSIRPRPSIDEPVPRSSRAPGVATATWIAAALVVAGVPAIALALRWWHPFDGYDHTVSRRVNEQIASLLAGEQLVPPPPLAPALFATPEVEQARPFTATASREWALLDPEFRQRLLLTMQIMRERHRIEMVLLEGFRSPERQAQLAALGPQVTMAGAGNSRHQSGHAADCAFLFDGRVVVSEQDPRAARAYALYGAVARSVGLTWGGAWRTLKDLGHVELRRPDATSNTSKTSPSLDESPVFRRRTS